MRFDMTIPANIQPILAELRLKFEAFYGDRLVQMILYGSQARGDAEPYSDIDVLVLWNDVDLDLRTAKLRFATTWLWNKMGNGETKKVIASCKALNWLKRFSGSALPQSECPYLGE
jgi:UTP:GlnB (protein PII) uridylyltransferase